MMDSEERKRFRKKVRKLWESNRYTFDEVCQELDMEPGELNRLAERMGLGERPECDVYIPTPEEIRLRAAAVRAGWSSTDHDERLEGASAEAIAARWKLWDEADKRKAARRAGGATMNSKATSQDKTKKRGRQ